MSFAAEYAPFILTATDNNGATPYTTGHRFKLAEKLRQIRLIPGLSQSAFLTRLRVASENSYNRISDYELDKFDDRLDLPKTLPGTVKYEAWKSPRPRRPDKKRPKTS